MQTARVNDDPRANASGPPCRTIWGAQVRAWNCWGTLFRVQATCCSHLGSCRCRHLCGCVTPKPRLCDWSGRTAAGRVMSPRAARERRFVVLSTVPSPRAPCLLPAPEGKQGVGEPLDVWGSSLPAASRGHASPPPHVWSPCGHLGAPRPCQAFPVPWSFRKPPRAGATDPDQRHWEKESSCVFPRARTHCDISIDNRWGTGGTVSPRVPHGHRRGEAGPG